MKNSFKLLMLLTLISSSGVFAENYRPTKLEVTPPFTLASCEDHFTDRAGTLGLSLIKVTTSETKDSIVLGLTQKLKMCDVKLGPDGTLKFGWTDVDPFRGYQKPYYDEETRSLEYGSEKIDFRNKKNRFVVGACNELGEGSIGVMTSVKTDGSSIFSSFEIDKQDILKEIDINALKDGEEIKVKIILSSVLNTTLVTRHEVFSDNQDTVFSGRYFVFTFTKVDSNLKLKNLSIK